MATWAQTVSRAVVNASNTDLSGLELSYHRKNAVIPISPQVFLSRFGSLRYLLTNMHGFNLFIDKKPSESEDTERYLLINEYDRYVLDHRPNGNDTRLSITTFCCGKQLNLRTPSDSPLGVGAYFLTIDYLLYRFDWDQLREKHQLGITVLPSQFLQMLRPFLTRSDDFDRKFVETFAIPEFRTIAVHGDVTTQVLAYLNNFSGIDEATASRILANQVLRDSLLSVKDDSLKFVKLMEKVQ